jgi:exosortase B
MSAVIDPVPKVPASARPPLLPASADRVVLGLLLLGFAALYVPSYFTLAELIWPTDEQGHGPIILAVSLWLLWRLRFDVAAPPVLPEPGLGFPILVIGLLLYAFGRSQSILMFEVGSQLLVLPALVLLFLGTSALRVVWFPLFFLLFMVPLPEALVGAVTAPLKSAVSAVASELLYAMGYPVGRAGVILNVGQYQLLVADACAGLNSMFTLEALGLLYMNLMNYTNVRRNLVLAVLIIPISFVANIVRVMILVLVTYHFGDEAGQGFIHGFAGMVLFLAGLTLMLLTDKFLALLFRGRNQRA